MSSLTGVEVSKTVGTNVRYGSDFLNYCKGHKISLSRSLVDSTEPTPALHFFDLPYGENGTSDQKNVDFLNECSDVEILSIDDFICYLNNLSKTEKDLLHPERPNLFYLCHSGRDLHLAIVQFMPMVGEWHVDFFTFGYHREHFDYRLICKQR